jgi:hypothetical protein
MIGLETSQGGFKDLEGAWGFGRSNMDDLKEDFVIQ